MKESGENEIKAKPIRKSWGHQKTHSPIQENQSPRLMNESLCLNALRTSRYGVMAWE
jgi:hypothetical protein